MTWPFDLELVVLPLPDSPSRRVVELRLVARADAARTKVAIALALDRSSSMRGAPLEDAKRAAIDVVRLLADDDAFALVTFDRQVVTQVAPGPVGARREEILEAIAAIVAGYGTDLGAAGERVLQHARSMGSHARALLFTDGFPFVGRLRPEELGDAAREASKGIPLTTVGFGHHIDPEVLHAMATQTTGRFLQLAPSVDPRLGLGTELGSYQATVAHDVCVEVDLAEGVSLGTLHHRGPVRVEGRRFETRLAPVALGEPSRLVFELEWDQTSPATPESFGEVKVRSRGPDGTSLRTATRGIASSGGEPAEASEIDIVLATVATTMLALVSWPRHDRLPDRVGGPRYSELSLLADSWKVASHPKVRAAFYFYGLLLSERTSHAGRFADLMPTIDGIERQYEARFGYARDADHGFDLQTPGQADGERSITRVGRLESLRGPR